jgi:hypothetical protein
MNNEGASVEMPRYTSHKKVWALKIKEIKQSVIDPSPFEGGSYTITPEDGRYAPFDVPRDYVERHFAEDGGYYVVYADGYKSYSPAKAFEEGYTPVDSESHHHAKSPDLRSFTQDEMDNWFSYHAPTPEQIIAYGEIRTAAKIFAETVKRHVPASADKTAAMREIRGAVMAANLAVACFQEMKRPSIAELEAILQKNDDTPITINTDGSISAI